MYTAREGPARHSIYVDVACGTAKVKERDYDKAVSLDQIGIVVEMVDDTQRTQLRDLFAKHQVIDVFEETVK